MKEAYYYISAIVLWFFLLWLFFFFKSPFFLALIIAIPIVLLLIGIATNWEKTHKDGYLSIKWMDSHHPLIHDRKEFLKAQPFFCDECKTFTDSLLEYCENCGTKNSLRKATKDDFKFYTKRIREDSSP
jgi:hypothetical protein